MIHFIEEYWLGVVFSVILSFATYRIKKVQKAMEKKQEDDKHIKEGVLGLLHNSLFRSCEDYINRGEITTEELDNLTILYDSYHSLGGNGTGTALYERCKNLNIKTQ